MHRTLRIPEMVHLIISHVAAEDGASDLAVLARTCTSFHDTALDELWARQSSIINLIRCMPEDLWETVDMGVSRRPTLTRAPEVLHVFEVLRRPRITSIHVGFGGADDDYFFLSSLARMYPALVMVVISPVYTPPENRSQLSTFVRELSHVQCLRVGTLDLPALRHLGQLTTLETLHATLPSSLSFPGISERSMFRNLRAVKLRTSSGGNIFALTAFVRMWNSPPLESFQKILLPRTSPVLEGVEDFNRALAAHCSPEHLKIFNFAIFSHIGPDASRYAAYFLRYLFAFPNLTVVSIRVPVGFDLNDTTITDMARAWSRIKELRLASRSHCDIPGNTLLGLRALAEHCPYLHTLEMSLDATTVPVLVPAPQFVHGQLVSFNVAHSRISHAYSVARSLSSLFYNLKTVTTSIEEEEEEDDNEDDPIILGARLNHVRWKEVETLLLAIREEE
ncbi:hypothetical protein C8R44DRAFT_735807 [Mycena epipterygia]|nr:hypothetical protein C8R44DRAFT_735807 [Mycena epipterygia]